MVLVQSLSVGCGGSDATDSLPDCASEGFVEYLHTHESSRFYLGENVVFEAASGVQRWVGDQGVFSIREPRGVARGIMNADSSALALPSLSPEEVHDDEALRYYTDSGLPVCQVDTIERWWDAGPRGVHQISVLRRGFDGIPIVESIASVRWNDLAQSVSETVHWPRIGLEVLNDAVHIREASEAPESELLASVTQELGPGFEVLGPAIRHSNAASSEPFFELAVLQVVKNGVLYNFDLDGSLVIKPSSRE